MKVKTELFGVFYKNRGKWVGPAHGELYTKEQLVLDNGSIDLYLKDVRRYFKKSVKLMRQTWEG